MIHALCPRSNALESVGLGSDRIMLSKGRELVRSVFKDVCWQTVILDQEPSFSRKHSSFCSSGSFQFLSQGGTGKVYSYAFPSPQIDVGDSARPVVLKEWDAPLSPSDLGCLHDLEEFVSTALGYTSLMPPNDAPGINLEARSGRNLASPSDHCPSKPVKLDHGPLHSLLPLVRAFYQLESIGY